MALPIIFANLAAGVQPLSDFDTMFNNAATMSTIACTAGGTANAITLAPNTNMPTVTAYANYQAFGFVAAATSTGAVTINISGVGALPVYAPNGTTQLATGSITVSAYYVIVYNSALNSGGGGFQLLGAGASASTAITASSINSHQIAGLNNRIINGDFSISQYNGTSSTTIVAATGWSYAFDRWTLAVNGANITAAQVAGSGPDQFALQITGAASVTGINVAQPIESSNVYDLAGTTVTLSAKLSNSLLTTVTWAAYYPSAADNYTSKILIATGAFTVSATPATYSTQITLPSNCTNGCMVAIGVGAQTSGTFTIAEVQLEPGTIATPFERIPIGNRLAMCQRYCSTSYPYGSATGSATHTGMVSCGLTSGNVFNLPLPVSLPVIMRGTPTITFWDGAGHSSKFSTTASNGTTFTDNQSGGSPFNISPNVFSILPVGGAVSSTTWLHFLANAEINL